MSLFDKIKIKRPRSSKFDLSHEKKLSMKMGDLVPIYLEEIIPGDSLRVSSEVFIRFAPLLAPIMHRVNATIHYFFVPNRLVWDEWQTFITGGEDGEQTAAFPTIKISEPQRQNFAVGTLADYFGIPTTDGFGAISSDPFISALPFRAYNTIYNEYYRDQNLTPEIYAPTGSGEETTTVSELTKLRKRSWEKDYFTSALPWPQRGQDVVIPVTTPFDPTDLYNETGSNVTGQVAASGSIGFNNGLVVEGDAPASNTPLVIRNLESGVLEGTSVTVNELRRAYRLQEWLEKNARAGSRYIEQILSHFGVRSSDARLQRPEYLGGGKMNVVISEVLNTTGIEGAGTGTADGHVQGYMAGHGVSLGKSNSFTRKFEEHGYVLGIMSVLPRTAYQQGLHRTWTKFDKFDYAWPEFANLGEQEIKTKELYTAFEDDGTINETTFGYQSRYSEYKYGCSTVHGEFRGKDRNLEVSELNYWHMGRIFPSAPALNTAFVESDPTTRIFNVTEGVDTLYVQIYNKVSAIRPLPYFGTPVT